MVRTVDIDSHHQQEEINRQTMEREPKQRGNGGKIAP